MEDLTRHYQPGNHFPLLLVKVADWYDIRPFVQEGTIEALMGLDEDTDMDAIFDVLENYESDYELLPMTQLETDGKITALMERDDDPLPIYRHIAVLMIYGEDLKRHLKPYL